MWKKSLGRGAVSYCVSVTIHIVIQLISVYCGSATISTPDFIARAGGEPAAALLQPLLIGLIGFAFGAGSVLFEIERWSFLKQGAAHFTVTAAVWIIVELICFSPITPPVVLSFSVSTAISYAVTWGIRYFVWREQVRQLNKQIHRMNGEEKNECR